MKIFKTEDGKVYLNKESIPTESVTDNSETLSNLNIKLKIVLEEEEKLKTEYYAKIEQRKIIQAQIEQQQLFHNKPIKQKCVELEVSALKGLSMLGYKHIVMPDVFLEDKRFRLKPDIQEVKYWDSGIIGEIHDKVIIYKREPTYASSIYKRGLGYVNGKELKWIAKVKTKNNLIYQIYLDENRIRLGEPGSPMKYDDIKNALSGLFYIDRTLNYNETKQLILAEMTKQLLKGK